VALAVQVTFDAADPRVLADFWELALGYQKEPPPGDFPTWEDWAASVGIPEATWNDYRALIDPAGKGPRLFFQKVPEPKTAKNRVHLDVRAAPGATDPEDRKRRLRSYAETLVAAGARIVREFDERTQFWIVMQDPEGNEFCLD
jgi:Glyoxalase-like domain